MSEQRSLGRSINKQIIIVLLLLASRLSVLKEIALNTTSLYPVTFFFVRNVC